MTLIAFTVPDDPAALPAWFERRLLAPDFGRFVAELTATFPSAGPASAQDLLGDWYEYALDAGFDQVPAKRLRRLLRQPSCLLGLQEAVLTEGGVWWDEVAADADGHDAAVARGRAHHAALFAAPPAQTDRQPKRVRTYKAWATVATALAACLLFVVGYLAWPTEREPRGQFEKIAWGWGRPGGLANDATNRADYLNGLAKSADEWFEQRPTHAPVVGQRIAELRAGCSKLILSSYGPLPPDDKTWLLAKCREWAAAMDRHLAAVESGADPVGVRTEVDETIRGISTALRDRAANG